MPEIHLRQAGFTCNASGSFTKNKERIKKIKRTGYSQYLYQNELDKASFLHHMVYREFKGFPKRTAADKVLRDQTCNIAKNPEYNGYQRGVSSMVYKYFDKKASAGQVKN